MPLVPNKSVVPPGGYHFIDRTGGDPVRIEGASFEEVAQRVLQHRLANGRAPGNPAQELIDYVCGNWGHFCHETNPAEIQPTVSRPGAQGLSTRCATWIAQFYNFARSDRGVPQAETERRANVCAGCPHNVRLEGGCGSCLENIRRLFFVWRRDRPVPSTVENHACFLTAQHNGAAALAEVNPPVAPEVLGELPAHCWRK